MSVQSDALYVEEDGTIELGDSVEGLSFHQALNVFLVTTKDGRVRVYDPHSCLKLSDVQLQGKNVVCVYHGESNSVVVCGGRTVGMRRDHHGVLLLDTVLQAPVAAPEETVTVEMLLSEGIQLQQTLGAGDLSNIDHAAEVREVLSNGIAAHHAQSRINPKLAKWSTLRLELPLGVLRSVCLGLISELKRLTRYIPALSTASALNHRLAHLLPPPTPDTGQGPPGSGPPDRDAMFSEASRLATFIKWPHMNYKWALPEQMAQAGFYHQPIASDDDRAMCFICSVCLVYWEPTDEPWSEHERHSPNCPFVKGEYTHNVPLSVTYATSPALTHSERAEEVSFISHTNSHQFIASATKHGSIVVWNTAKELKKEVSFSIDPSDSTILDKHFSDTVGYTDVPLQPPAPREAWPWGEEEQNVSVNIENDPPTLPGPHSEGDGQGSLAVDTDASNIQSPPSPSTPPLPPASPPSQIPPAPPAPPPPTAPPSSQVVELPLDDIAVDELFAPPRPSHDVRVSSLCILADPNEVSQRYKGAAVNLSSSVRSCLVVGVGLRRYELFGTSSSDRQETCDVGLVQVLNNVNQASQREAETLDIMKLDSSRRGSLTEEENDSDCIAVESESASLSDPTVVSTSVSAGQQNFVPYLLVYDLNVMVPQATTSNKVATKTVSQGPYKKSTVKVGTFGQSNISYSKSKQLWSDPLANDIEMFFAPPNVFVKNKGTSQVSSTSTSKSKAKDNQVPSEPESKNDLKKEPKCIQCIPLPHKLNSVKLHLTVDQIVPTTCGEYIIVTLSRSSSSGTSANSGSSTADSIDGAVGGPREVFGAVIVYKVCRGGEVVTLQEEPINTKLLTSLEMVPKKLLVLPPEYGDNGSGLSGLAACITFDGSLRLLSLSNLEFFHHLAPSPGRPYNNAVYCNSLERLCVSCDDGRISLVQLRKGTELGKDIDSASSASALATSVPSNSTPTLTREPELMPGELLVNQGMSEEVLDKCVELTQFQTGCPRFVATVPPCWSEIIQAQKQRRNPQHLQQHAEDMDTTRTWRLESDSSTWDEHLFELLLPAGAGGTGGVQVGHIDLKLNFIPGPPNPLPVLQVTLLRQNLTTPRRQNTHQGSTSSNATSTGSPSQTQASSSSNIPDDVLEDYPENPVLTKEFQYTHNAEILCGPVTVNRCMDLSGQGANVTLTSPSLLACRTRTYLVHIKALPPKLQQQQQQQQQDLQKNSDLDLVTQYMPPQSSTFLDRLAASSNKRVELVRGCDIIQELSITVRCCAKTTILHDRLQRLSIVENETFHKNLIEAVISDNSSDHIRHRALDLLLWITSIHTAAIDDRTVSVGIITLLQLHLSGLVRACILLADRSIAHKTAKIIVTALEGSRVVEGGSVFGWAVLEALLEWLDHILQCQSAGALHWFFTLLNHVKWCNPWGTARKVTQLLSTVSEAVSGKVDPLHAVLQTKFNLYGTPFERELFDIEPPLLAKQTISGNNLGHSGSSHNTSNNNNNNNNNISFGGSGLQGGPGGGVQSSSNMTSKNNGPGTAGGYLYSGMGRDDSDIGGLLGRGGSQGSTSLGLSHTSALCGLLEVEPLHFSLHMASDGTKMERASTGTGHPGSPFMMQPFTIPGGLDTSILTQVEASTSSGTAKAVDVSVTMLHKAVEDMAVKNQALELRLAKKATKTYLEKLQTLSDQLASMKHCLQKAKQRTQTLAKVVAAENSGSQAVDPLLPLDVESKAADVKEEASTISSSSSDATPDHEGVNSCLLQECEDVIHTNTVQYIGNGHVGSDVSSKIDFGLTSLDKEEADSSKHSSQQGSNTKRKSEEDVSSLESKSSTPSASHPQAKESTNTGKKISSAVQGSLGAPWQQLLSLPPQQMLVIERMHSGARRFVVLDFGAPVLLTDVVIPACGDLVSLSIDIWMTGEEMDGERLVVASDIGMRPLILADLQPPPLCRYLKVTTLGRYGMNTSSQCRIPVGAFYGHTLILPWQLHANVPQPGIVNKLSAQTQLTVLSSVVEDIGCRYSLACSKLRSLLNPLLMSPTAPTGPNSSSGLSEPPSLGSRDADLEKKITQAYQECMLEQQHLNLVVSVMRRLQRVVGAGEGQFSPTSSASRDSKQQFVTAANCASDKLATLMQYLLNCLLTLSLPIPSMSVPHNLMEWCGPEQARVLVEQVCVRGPKGAQVGVASLLARLCAGQPWWGDFLANTMITLFSSSNTLHFPATRVFALLTFLGQKSVGSGRGSQVIDAVLRVLSAQLHSSGNQAQYGTVPVSSGLDNTWQPWQLATSQVDTHLISWLLLYLSLCLDALTPTRKNDSDKGKENGGRWTWLTAETCLQRRGSEASRSAPRASRDRLRKRLVHHQKQQLVNLETATKSLGEVTAGQVLAGLSGEIYQKLDTIRRSIVRRYSRTTSASSSGGGGRKDDGDPTQDAFMPLDRANALSVAHGLIKLLMNSSSPCCVDSFLLTCKVIGGLVSVTRPSPALTEIVTRAQLGALLRHALTLDTTWGAPWALHALTCLLQDILEGERLYGNVVMNAEQHREEVENFDLAMEGARAVPSTSGSTSSTSAMPGPSGAGAPQSASSPAGPSGNGMTPAANGSAVGGGGSPQGSASPLGGACVVTQNCQADQSATPLSPPVVSMATAHYTTLEEEDIPGKYSFLDLEDSSESEDMIGEYLADMPAFVGGASNNSISSFELAMSNLPPPYPPPPLPTQSSVIRTGKDSRIGDLVTGPLATSHPGMDHSTAVDARLEAGVSLLSELRLHMMAAVHTSRLSLAVTAPLKVNNGMWGDTEVCGPGDLAGSVELLTDVFQKILLHLSMQFDGSHIESVLGLWLSINLELAGGKYAPSVAPTVPLTPRAISALLAAVVRSGSVSMRCWCLVLQTLTLCCNYTPQEPTPQHTTSADQYDHVDLTGMSMNIVTDSNFVPALQKLLTGSCATGSDMRSDVVGSTVTGLLEDLLVRLRVRCDVISVTSGPGTTLKHALLSLVARLLEPQGAISLAMGPLDAQCCLLGTLLSMHYDGLDRMHVPLTIISSTVVLVHGHLVSSEGMTYGANNQNATLLGGLFASVLGSDGRQGPAPSRLALLCSLLNLSRKLAQTPLVNPAQVRVGVTNYEAQENAGGSLTDSSKLEQQRTDASSSQTDEHKAMHTSQTCSHAAPNSVPCLADTVLQNGETMQLLLKSVAACEGSSVSMLLGTVSGEVSEKLCLGETLTDALYQLLLTLNAKATAPDLILRPVVEFITPGGWWSPPSLSEPALCFFTRVLDCPAILEKFAALGGMKMLWENLVSSVGMMGGGRGGLVTAVMNHLAPPLPPSTHNTPSNKRNETVEQNQGLYNFAPLAVVTSSNPTARPANVLVDSNQLFQRTKTAPWSYHFYPDESWVDLNLTLPCAVLLHEVHLLPHTVSLVSCPSAVSVEVGVEGGYLMPVSGPLSTAGLSRVRLVLPRPVVASIVVVRLHRPRDSSTLGLSQLKLLGTTTFREASRGVHETAISDHTPHRASMWWLRLIHQCMCRVEGGLSVGVEAGASVSGVMEACVTLLLTPPGPLHLAPLGSAPLEATTLALAALSPQLLHTLIMTLLTHPLLRQPAGGNSLDAAIALLYELCVGNSSMEGVTVLISWLNHIVVHPTTPSPATDDYHSLGTTQQHQQRSPQEPCVNGGVSAEVLHCIAAVLWNTPHDTTSLITDELFRRVYEWSERVEGEVKIGLDHIMCSMCHVRPQLFTQLLLNMAVLTVIDNNQSITDDRKDREAEIRAARTDDMKEGVEGSSGAVEGRLILQDPSVISLTPAHLQTLATVAQSPQAIHLMLDSGFPLLLVHGILEWCKTEVLHQVESCTSSSAGESATDLEKASVAEKSRNAEDTLSSATPQAPPQIRAAIVPTLSTSLVAHTLHTLAALCAEPPMKDWLGSAEGSVFWLPLLTVLGDPLVRGSEPLMRGSGPSGGSDSDYSSVEDATIHLMRQCCHNHPHNQNLLASTLCHLIQRQNIPPPGGVSYLHSLSGFTRRLVLQLLLETERVVVHINSPQGGLSSPTGCSLPLLTQHPKFGAGHKTRLLNLPTTTSMSDIVKMVTDWSRGVLSSSSDLELGGNGDRRDANEVGHLELVDKLSVAAGVTAKDKREKNKVNSNIHNRMSKKATEQESQSNKPVTATSSASSYVLVHESLGSSSGLPSTLTVAQVMAALRHEGHPPASHITLTLTNRRDHAREGESGREALLLCTEPLPSTLHVFTSQGGLSLLAQHMSLLYPDTGQQQPNNTASVRTGNGDKGEIVVENDWVSVEMNDYESANVFDYLVMGGGSGGSPGPMGGGTVSLLTLPSIPPHALGAFTLFLRLPGYAETLLKDTHKACCLLRLALGVTDDGDGGDIVGSGVGGSLATMPFQVLESLLEATPLTTDDGLLLRRMCLESGALHLILACLAALSHQDTPEVVSSLYHQNVPIGLVVATTRATCVDSRETIGMHRGEGDRCHYWAKGTGFGTGSTTQSWDVEQALVRQKVEEEHVVWLVRLLAQYINPGDILPPELQQQTNTGTVGNNTAESTSDSTPLLPPLSPPSHAPPPLPPALLHLFQNSGLITTIASNLSNDSVLDMSRHVPLYRALLALVRGLSVTPGLAPLLLTPQNSAPASGDKVENTSLPCIPALLEKMKTTVNTYMAKLRWKSSKAGGNNGNGGNGNSNGSNNNNNSSSLTDDAEQEEGLSLIVPDIQNTAVVVKVCTDRLQQELEREDQPDGGAAAQPVSSQSLMEVYLAGLKPLQFDTYEMVVEDSERGIRFVVPHHYEGSVRGAGDLCSSRRMKRLAQEAVTLSTSLPLSYSSSVFVRTDLDRLDIMKVLITGPEDTPYANGCFEFDVYFPVDYPTSPLHINLQTTGEGRVRFNPNLYQDGKVCLSILNTWHGRPEEKWNPQTSSLLQVLVSIQSLIFVSEPYFNEPGYERSRGTPAAMQNSREYDANIRAATVRWGMLNQLRNPSPCFKEVIERHFWLKHKEILEQIEAWIADMETLSENRRAGKNIAHNTVGLKKNFQLLKEEFRKMSPPPGLEGVPLTPSLINSCSRSPAQQLRDSSMQDKEREGAQAESEKEMRGAAGGQAGGPVRTRIRKTSRANLFMGKPQTDASKHGSHSTGIPVTKVNSSSSNSSSSTAVNSTTVMSLQYGVSDQEVAEGGLMLLPLGEQQHSVSLMPELVQATKTTTCPSADDSKVDDEMDEVEDDVCNHVNHSSSSVKNATSESPSSHNTSAGMPC